MKKVLMISGSVLLLGLVATMFNRASAADPAPASFETLDANKDGRISASEARKDKGVAARFAAADKDQDGYLSRAEFDALRAGR